MLLARTFVVLCGVYWLFPLRAAAQDFRCLGRINCEYANCTPVAYLFRHAEEGSSRPTDLTDDTLLPVGNRHAALYPGMIQRLQEKSGYCPVEAVFAMARKNAPDAPKSPNGLGTTNPFFTARPLAIAVLRRYDFPPAYEEDLSFGPITSTDPEVTEINNDQAQPGLLYEYLPYTETRDSFRQLIKHYVNNLFNDSRYHASVAIFWSSQGMNEVAKVLGNPIPAYSDPNYKAPRNSIYIFSDYDSNAFAETGATVTGKFNTISVATNDRLNLRTGTYIQCFNHGVNSPSFPFYCSWSGILGSDFLDLQGAVCDVNKLPANSATNDYIGSGTIESGACF